MGRTKIAQDRQQGRRVTDFLVSIRVILTFLNHHLGVVGLKGFVEQVNMTHNPQPVGENAGLLRIAEMTIDILQLHGGIGAGRIRQEAIDTFVWIKAWVHFRVSLGLLKLCSHELRVIFGDMTFNPSGIKDETIGKLWIHLSADGFCQAHQVLENFPKVGQEILLKPGQFGGVRHLIRNITFTTVVVLYSAWQVFNRTMDISDFVTLLNGSQQLSGQITRIIGMVTTMQENDLYITNYLDFMNYNPTIDSNDKAVKPKSFYPIVFDSVGFSYPNTGRKIINNMNISIQAEQRIAIVGRNGAGKSTIGKLLLRLYDPDKGTIYFDDNNIKDYDVNSLRNKIGVVFQDFQIYAVSIAENVLMRPIKDKETDESIVKHALNNVGLLNKIEKLDDGIYTIMSREYNENGVYFSGGEEQKLAIARLFTKQNELILLDEPSSLLDAFTENEIVDTIFNLGGNAAVVYISHRLTNLRRMDRILYIENGVIFEDGTHAELMRTGGKYAAMYNEQVSRFN